MDSAPIPETSFVKPADMIGAFAVVKLWPGIKVAEDEVIARIKIAAEALGLTCIEISPEGQRIDTRGFVVTSKDVDFVIHLHYETPKTYDIFSFVALWNPLRFYYDYIEGGYRRFSDNLMSHDDFLSCASPGADDHVRRMVANSPNHLPPRFTMFHSLAKPIVPPSLGARKLFYAGINWERLGKQRSRHQDLLDRLDKTGDLRIYGPYKLHGVEVWHGYKSYMGEIPFDGVSVVNEIASAGISLVLSSESHKESGLMSSRLFESLAAGAVIICDDNPFARRYFGDALLYIDGSAPVETTHQQIVEHLCWIRANEQKALELARRAQEIFRNKFTLDRSIADIYNGFAERKAALAAIRLPVATPPVTMFLLLSSLDKTVLLRHLASAKAQAYRNIQFVLLVDSGISRRPADILQKTVKDSGVDIELRPVDFFARDSKGRVIRRALPGKIMYEQLCGMGPDSYACFVGEHEGLFGDHVDALVKALTDRNHVVGPDRPAAAYADVVLKDATGQATTYKIQRALDIFHDAPHAPLGLGRFLFGRPSNIEELSCVLPYLGAKAPALLAAQGHAVAAGKTTIIRDIDPAAPEDDGAKDADFHDKIMCDFLPSATIQKYKLMARTEEIVKTDILASLENTSIAARRVIVRELFLSLPLPKFIQNFVRFVYRKMRH